MAKKNERTSIGALLEGVRWDSDEAPGKASLLTPMSRFFRDFPWEGQKNLASTKKDEDLEEEDSEPI